MCLSGLLWLGLCSCLAVTPIQPPPVCHDEMVAELTAANMWRPPEPNRESGVIAALPPTPQEERAELAPVAGADGSKVSTPDVIQALPPRAKEAPPESPAIFVYEGSLQPRPSATLRTSTAHRLLGSIHTRCRTKSVCRGPMRAVVLSSRRCTSVCRRRARFAACRS